MDNEIKLKIPIDGKEAVASITLTDEELTDLAKKFREVGNESKTVSGKIISGFWAII